FSTLPRVSPGFLRTGVSARVGGVVPQFLIGPGGPVLRGAGCFRFLELTVSLFCPFSTWAGFPVLIAQWLRGIPSASPFRRSSVTFGPSCSVASKPFAWSLYLRWATLAVYPARSRCILQISAKCSRQCSISPLCF